MYRDERDIYYYDVISKVWSRKYANGLPNFSHWLLATALDAMFKKGRAEFQQSGTRQSIYIADMTVFDDRCEMLLGFSDPRAADPALADRKAKTRRVIKKVDEEGLEHSAHVIWHYKNKVNTANCAFYLEGATGLGSGAIIRFLNRILRLYNDVTEFFSVDDPSGALGDDGSFKKIKVRPSIELIGHPSSEFIKDLKAGSLSEVELYTEAGKNQTHDAHGYAVEKSRSLLIVPNPMKYVPKAFAMLGGVLPQKKDKYEYARVRFKTESNVTRNVRIYSSNYNLVSNDSYVKKERIEDLGGPLPSSFAKFWTPIMTKMRVLAKI